MSVGSIGNSALAPLFSLSVRSRAHDKSPDSSATLPASGGCDCGGTSAAQSPATPSFGSLADLNGLSAQGSHLALQIRSRSQQVTASDGTVSERSSTKLRFHYDLTTADGQHIELNVKAKVQEASVQDAAGNSVSKTQVKLQFSLLQEGVANDLAPLQSDQVPSATQNGVAGGLQDFLNSVGDAVQQFTSGDNVSADDLVTKTVDTFNTLLDALGKLLFPATANEATSALPPPSAAPSPPPADPVPVLDTSNPVPTTPAPLSPPPAPLPPVSDPGSDATSSPPAAAPADAATSPAPSDPVTQPAFEVPPVPESPASDPAPAADSAPPPADPAPASSATQLATQVLQTARLHFTQSLTQIIQTLNSQDQSGNSSTLTTQRLSYHSSLSLKVQTASLVDSIV